MRIEHAKNRIKHSVITFFAIFLIFHTASATACKVTSDSTVPLIVVPPKFKGKTPERVYSFQLLKLVLEKTVAKYGPCKAVLLDKNLPTRRIENYLQNNRYVDVINLTATTERDQLFLPIKIPTDKGLMGMRLSFIRKGEQARFSKIKNIEQLKQMVAGQGAYWKDVKILRDAGLQVKTNHTADPLPTMLAHQRFDYLPRGSLQLIPELKTYAHLPIEVEKTFAILYPSFSAFYVNKENTALAQRLEYGLSMAFDDGSFEAFFRSHHETVDAMKRLQLEKRRYFKICNPYAPAWTPSHIDKYWISPWPKHLQNPQCINQN